MAKVIMVQGTMSNAGKSLIVAGLCRIFAQDGYRVVPFKSQNMALNSYITEDGLEMGRAQVMQAEAAGVKPSVLMNPILLKPTNDVGSQVIVKGEVLGNMRARDYFAYKKKLIPTICEAFSELEKQADIIVMEGAGVTKLPNLAAMQEEYGKLQAQKEALYADYGNLKKQVKEYDVIKQNIDSILRQPREPEREKGKERGE